MLGQEWWQENLNRMGFICNEEINSSASMHTQVEQFYHVGPWWWYNGSFWQ